MAKTLLVASFVNGGTTTTAATTEYHWLSGHTDKNATEANRDILFRTAGTLSNLYARVQTNSTTGASTIRTRKNAGNGGQSQSIGIAATGKFEDTSGTDTVAAGDKLNIQTVTGTGGTINFRTLSTFFNATTNTVSVCGCTGTFTTTTASTTWFLPIQGHNANLITTETFQKCRIRKSFTAKNMGVYVSAARAQATTVRSRKNGANGNLVVTCTGSTTGWFEDTGNSDTLAAADDYDYSVTTGTGADTLTIQTIKCEYVSTGSDGLSFNGKGTGTAVTDNTIMYYPIGGTCDVTGTESVTQTKARLAWTLSNLEVMVSQNGVSSASTCDVRKNAASTTITASITGSTTGLFADNTHTETLATTDEINFRLTVPSVAGTQTVTITNIGIHTSAANDYTVSLSTETVTVSDTSQPTRMLAAKRNPQETTNSSENLARMLAANRALSTETTTIGESLARVRGQSRSLATEIVTISEVSLNRMLSAIRSLPETTTIGETLLRMLAANRPLSTETVTVSEDLQRIRGAVVVLATQTVTVGESLNRMLAATRSLPETTSTSDAVARMLGASRTLPENIVVSDNLTRLLSANRALATQVTAISDSLNRLVASTRSLPENVTVNDSLTKMLAASRTLATETVTINETLQRMLAARRTLQDTTSITEDLAFEKSSGTTNYNRSITENTTISESLQRMLAATRILNTETTSISDDLNRMLAANRAIASESTPIGEILQRLLAAFRTLQDTITTNDSTNRTYSASRPIQEDVSITDSLSRRLYAFRTLVENIDITDLLEHLKHSIDNQEFIVNLIENVLVSDNIRTWLSPLKIFKSLKGEFKSEGVRTESQGRRIRPANWFRSSFYTYERKRNPKTNTESEGQ